MDGVQEDDKSGNADDFRIERSDHPGADARQDAIQLAGEPVKFAALGVEAGHSLRGLGQRLFAESTDLGIEARNLLVEVAGGDTHCDGLAFHFLQLSARLGQSGQVCAGGNLNGEFAVGAHEIGRG